MEQLGFLEPLSCRRAIFLRQTRLLENYFHSRIIVPPRRQKIPLLRRRISSQSNFSMLSKLRGVTSKTAQELVETHPLGRIRTKIEVFDWLLRNEDKRVGKNPAGYLVASIRSDYQIPGDYRDGAVSGQIRRSSKRQARLTCYYHARCSNCNSVTTFNRNATKHARPNFALPGINYHTLSERRSWPR